MLSNRRMSHIKLSEGWMGWYLGGVKYRSPYTADNDFGTYIQHCLGCNVIVSRLDGSSGQIVELGE